MARDSLTKLYTRIVNSFSAPVAGTTISPTDAETFFDDMEAAFNSAVGTSQTGTGAISSATVFGYPYNRIYIPSDGVDVSGLPVGQQVSTGLLIEQYPNNGGKGFRNALTAVCWVPPASTVSVAADWGYCGGLLFGKTDVTLGGTNTGAGAKGAVFGGNSFVSTGAAATNLLGAVAHEFDMVTIAGSSMKIRVGVSSADVGSAVQGATYDAAYHAGATAGSIKWKVGYLISDMNGGDPIATTGKLFATQGAATVDMGIDISSYTCTTAAFKSSGFLVSGAGATTITSTSASALTVGRQGATDPAFKVNASTASQATGLQVIGAAAGDGVGLSAISSGTNELLAINAKGSGDIYLNNGATGAIRVGNALLPKTDDSTALGNGTDRWADLFLSTGGVINYNNGNYTITHSAGLLTFSGPIGINGSSSGKATIQATAAAGTPTLTLPTASGTFAVSASAPAVVNTATGNITITGATQSDQETATSAVAVVTPSVQHYHPSAAKAWVKFNSAGTVAASYNITSITDTAVGNWTVNIATDFSSANYAAIGQSGAGSTIPITYNNAIAAGTYVVQTAAFNTGALMDPATPDAVYWVGYGDQ